MCRKRLRDGVSPTLARRPPTCRPIPCEVGGCWQAFVADVTLIGPKEELAMRSNSCLTLMSLLFVPATLSCGHISESPMPPEYGEFQALLDESMAELQAKTEANMTWG